VSGGQRVPGPTRAPRPAAAIDRGTLARWRMPAPMAMPVSTPASGPTHATVSRAARQPGPDLAYLFLSCGAPRVGVSEQDFATAAATLGVEVAAIKAVAEVETQGSAFNADGRPTILYERHYFHRLTGGRFAKDYPDLSNPQAGGYGKFSQQYAKLERAFALDRAAALQSASWGRFQIMGKNYQAAGYTSVMQMVDRMAASESGHLTAFVHFVQADAAMHQALRDKDWAAFARRYNGRRYKDNDYDTKMAEAYQRNLPPPPQGGPAPGGMMPLPLP